MLIGRALVRPTNHVRLVLRVLTFYVEALLRTKSVNDTVSLEDAKVTGVDTPHRIHFHLLTLPSAVESEFVEHGSDAARLVQVPELVGRAVTLAAVHDDWGPRAEQPLVDIQNLLVQLAHDVECTPGGRAAGSVRVSRVGRIARRRVASRRTVRHR